MVDVSSSSFFSYIYTYTFLTLNNFTFLNLSSFLNAFFSLIFLKMNPVTSLKTKHSKKRISRQHTILFKRQAILNYDKCRNYYKVAKLLKINHSCVIRWVKIRGQIFSSTMSGKFRRIRKHALDPTVSSKRGKYPECEEKVYKWFYEQRQQNFAVSNISIRKKMADEVKAIEPDSIFSASYGWLKRFMKRCFIKM